MHDAPSSYVEAIDELAGICRLIHPDAPWVTLDEFAQQCEQEEWMIVDVRRQRERNISIIPGAMTMAEFKARVKKRPWECDEKSILVYCTAGCRSARYAKKLLKNEFKVFNLYGGILAWALDGRTFVTPDGEVTCRAHVYSDDWNVLPPGYEAVC
ncbi:MAG: rhodanese-like domain-containing protein [Chloroflexi bacterium]|nr:rhodanese-like domain-containing protein [Chloroflexota bacterium]